jgi:hypothetical protein
MKKIITIAVTVGVALSLAAACISKSQSTASNKVFKQSKVGLVPQLRRQLEYQKFI